MNYNPAPKSEFLKREEACKAHRALIQDTTLRESMLITILELQRRAAQHTPPENFNACAASHLRLLGAQDFMDTFLNLAEQASPVKAVDNTNLPGNVSTLKR